jgi:hypothetical protein
VEFSKKARQWRGLLLSNKALIEGMDYGTKAQGAEVVQIVWKGVEKWERRPKAGGKREFQPVVWEARKTLMPA